MMCLIASCFCNMKELMNLSGFSVTCPALLRFLHMVYSNSSFYHVENMLVCPPSIDI